MAELWGWNIWRLIASGALFKLFTPQSSNLPSQTKTCDKTPQILLTKRFNAFSCILSSSECITVEHTSPSLRGLLLYDSRSFDCPLFEKLKTLTALETISYCRIIRLGHWHT